jgi:outer membrane protein OmpA-like peptidoglycan-associated protein
VPEQRPTPARVAALIGAACLLPSGAAAAMELAFPAPAEITATLGEPLTSHALPIGPWQDGAVPSRIVEGPLTQTAWRIAAPGLTTLQLLAPLRDQLAAEGYRILWQCEADACGGFDFRYGIDVLPEPDMHVDLGDFRFLAAERDGPDGPQVVSLLVSRSSETGFVQMVSVGGPAPLALSVASSGEPAAPPPVAEPVTFGERLQSGGVVVLEDLIFESGSSELEEGEFDSLGALAAWLKASPDRRVALVGHTDASGGLVGNTALSKARATSVRQRLIQTYAVDGAQVAAEGVGYLVPRASNLTEKGRALNRRVEVMLLAM